MTDNTHPSHYKIPVPGLEYFKDLHTMVLVSTFPRSGSTLLGYLLTAHRNMVVASEPGVNVDNLYAAVPVMALFNYILHVDKMRFEDAQKVRSLAAIEKTVTRDNIVKRTYNKQDRYMFVPQQWQACCESLHVIGIKNSLWLANALLEEGVFEKFKVRLKKVKVNRLRFILTVRNPYDMVATGIVHRMGNPKAAQMSEKETHKMLRQRIKGQFTKQCEMMTKVFKLTKSQDIFVSKHEDLVASPVDQMRKLCKFLKVSAFPDYLNDCTAIVHKSPNKSRHELEWRQEQKEQVEELIEKYHFFAGYSWDS